MTSKILSQAIASGTLSGNSTDVVVSSNGAIQLAGNNTTDIFIAPNNNVGIGNTTPADALSVQGSFYQSTNTHTIGNAVYVAANGNFGVGTSTPSAKIEVKGNIIANSYVAANAGFIAYGGSSLTFYRSYVDSYGWSILANPSNSLTFNSGISGSGATLGTWYDNGNLGIGNTAPTQKLHIQGTGYATSDFRSPLFYDSDNTSYYTNPGGTSYLYNLALDNSVVPLGYSTLSAIGYDGAIRFSGDVTTTANVGTATYIPYIHWTNVTKTYGYRQHVVLGSYRDGNNNYGSFFIGVGGNDAYPTTAYYFDSNGNFSTIGSLTGTIFYDTNNTGYYVDPYSSSVMNTLLTYGYTTYNSSSGYRARYTNGADTYSSYLNWQGLQLGNNGGNYIVAGRDTAGGSLYVYTNATSAWPTLSGTASALFNNDGRFYSYVDTRTPLMYDSDNTSYYVDPNSISSLNRLFIDGGTSLPLQITTSSAGPWAINLYRSDTSFGTQVYNDGSSWNFQHRIKCAGNSVWDAGNAPGTVLQVVSTSLAGTFTSSAVAWTDVTSLTATITPKSTSSKILAIFTSSVGSSAPNANYGVALRLVRGATVVGVGNKRASELQSSTGAVGSLQNYSWPVTFNFLDSPSTTSATTYKVQMYFESASYTGILGGSWNTGNANYNSSNPTTLTLMEIAQ